MTLFRPISRAVLAAGLVLATALPAFAGTPVTYKDEGRALFQLDVPDFWNVRVGGSRMISPSDSEDEREIPRVMGLTPENEDDVFVGFMVPRRLKTLEQGVAYLSELGPQMVKDPEVSSAERRTIAGRPAMRIAGTGRRNGQNVEYTAVLLDLPGNRIAFSITVLQAGYDPAVLSDVNAIYNSFRAVR